MSLSDQRFAYGPFAPHWVPKQYIQNYFAFHRTDRFLVLNTTVEDLTRHNDQWKLTLRRYDAVEKVDIWWAEHFDAVVIANGHYSVPYVCLIQPESALPNLTCLPDTSCQRAGRIHWRLPWARYTFEVLPLARTLSQQEGSRHRQLCLRP